MIKKLHDWMRKNRTEILLNFFYIFLIVVVVSLISEYLDKLESIRVFLSWCGFKAKDLL